MPNMPIVMKTVLVLLVAMAVTGLIPLPAADTSATVTEAVNEVSHGSAQASATSPAKSGTRIQDGEYLKTGVKSRAELSLANQSITRLGANTIFNYSVANNEIDLQSGTILFSKPKDGKEMIIKTAAVTAAIVGTTGFAQGAWQGAALRPDRGTCHAERRRRLLSPRAGRASEIGRERQAGTMLLQSSPLFGHIPSGDEIPFVPAEPALYRQGSRQV